MRIEADTYCMTMWTMAVIAVIVFIALYFVKAGYGIFRTKQWGISINNKVAWVMMEAPVFIVMLYMWASNGASTALPAFLAFLLFELHYFQRSFVFPLMMKGKSCMPIAIMLMG
ncbi:MAG: 3-oxo-5-alpha-steroid 4-dehydrogenase, partial [Prevotella sp.]